MVALKTFNNLSPGRQDEIISASLEEFALHEYESASLSNIITKLNLAKGSFYRYFENKQSLYFFLLDHCINIRLKNDQAVINPSVTDFFDLMVEHLLARFRFDQKYPLHSAFLYNVMQEKSSDELGNIQLTVKLKAVEAIKPLVSAAIKNNTLRKDIELDAMSFAVFRMQFMILEYIELKYKINFRDNILKKKPFYEFSEKEMIKTARTFTDLFKRGIAKL